MQNKLRIALILVITFLFSSFGYAQIGNVDQLLRAGVADANLLIKEYLSPFGFGFGADLNNGWYSTAKTHQLGGFDLTVMASSAIAPTSDESFDLNDLPLQNMQLSNANANSVTPTIVGDDTPGPEVDVVLANPLTGQDEVVGSFQMPEGLGFRYVPSAVVQASIGLVMNTDVMIRFFPETEIDEDIGRFQMFGLGVKHDLKQWIPAASSLPFDLAVMLGYTTFQAESDLELEPDPDAVPTGARYDNQEVEVEAKSFTLNFIASKQFAILTLFGGLGYETSNVDLKLKGNYPVTIIETNPASANFGDEVIEDIVDPVDLSFSGENDLRFNVGFQVRLVFLALHASYTVSSYPVLNAGVGLTFR